MQYLKESIFHIEFNFTQKKYDLFEKIWKNQIFPIFFSKLMLTICLRSQISQICARKFQNWVYLCFGKVLKLKVTKGELIISNGLEMADAYLPEGVGATPPPPPPLLGLIKLSQIGGKITKQSTF